MKHSALIAVSLAALSLAGCKKEEAALAGDNAASATASDGATPQAGQGFDRTDRTFPMATASPISRGQAFADAAAASDSFEIDTSKLAAIRATSSKVKKFAAEMIKAHTQSTAKLISAASAASPAITPAARLRPSQQKMLDVLATKSGADFDAAYARAQVEAHQATLDALKSYSATGDVPSLKTFAGQIIPVVTAHLNMAKGL